MKTFFVWLVFQGIFARVLVGLILAFPHADYLGYLILSGTAICITETIVSAVLLAEVGYK